MTSCDCVPLLSAARCRTRVSPERSNPIDDRRDAAFRVERKVGVRDVGDWAKRRSLELSALFASEKLAIHAAGLPSECEHLVAYAETPTSLVIRQTAFSDCKETLTRKKQTA